MLNEPADSAGNNASAPPPSSASSTGDAWRFDYRLTGWARESHHAPIYCVAFCGKGALCGEEGGGE